MPISSSKTGRQGERVAAQFLENKGCTILERNYHVRGGEIDIIARSDEIIVFVEVKSTRANSFGNPATWVDERKQKRIGCAAERYLLDKKIENVDCRFDVITVDFTTQPIHINHTPDAFWLEE